MTAAPSRFPTALAPLMPAVFIFLWSTGFIGVFMCLPHAGAFTTLFLRFAVAAVALIVIGIATGARWPTPDGAMRAAIAGFWIHGVTFSGLFAAIEKGLPAGVAAIVMALQPVITGALAGRLLGERVDGRHWAGLAIGLLGVGLVVSRGLDPARTEAGAVALAFLGLAGFTIGTFYQKRHGAGMSLRLGAAVQFIAAAAVAGAAALAFEDVRVDWTVEFVAGLAWLVFGLSIGAVSLLLVLIREGQASRVTSLFFLSPPLAALQTWFLFDDRMTPTAVIGMAIAVVGVALVTMRPPARGPAAPPQEGAP